jgi:hypothetical protein
LRAVIRFRPVPAGPFRAGSMTAARHLRGIPRIFQVVARTLFRGDM